MASYASDDGRGSTAYDFSPDRGTAFEFDYARASTHEEAPEWDTGEAFPSRAGARAERHAGGAREPGEPNRSGDRAFPEAPGTPPRDDASQGSAGSTGNRASSATT